jgi:hypothetical protein
MPVLNKNVASPNDESFDTERLLRLRRNEPPQKSYMWRVELPDLSDRSRLSGVSYDPNSFRLADRLRALNVMQQQMLSQRVTSISIPFSTVETDKAISENSYWYYAKQNDIGQIEFEMQEFEDGYTLQWLTAWQQLMIRSEHGTYNPPVVYKKDLKFYRLSANKKDIHMHVYKGYFISGIADMSNDYEANDIVRYSVQLTGDSVEHNIFSVAGFTHVDPLNLKRLAEIFAVEPVLETVDLALKGSVKAATGLNIGGITGAVGGLGNLF